MKEPLIIKLNSPVTDKILQEYKQYLEKKEIKNVLFIPACMDIVQNSSGYRIYSKEEYKRYLLSNSKACFIKGIIEHFEEHWKRTSKGYNFIVGVCKEDKSMMVYSVKHFDKEVLGNGSLKKEHGGI